MTTFAIGDISSMAAPNPRFRPDHDVMSAQRKLAMLDFAVVDQLGIEGLCLLDQLAADAPGTFHHSVRIVEIIKKANIKLTPQQEAAILLHDIGKLVDPSLFAENCPEKTKRPDAHTLISHIDFGLMRINWHEPMPKVFNDAVSEHHGTLPAGEGKFYPGPIPTSYFTYTLMLADSLEAISGQEDDKQEIFHSIYHRGQAHGQYENLDRQKCEAIFQALLNSF